MRKRKITDEQIIDVVKATIKNKERFGRNEMEFSNELGLNPSTLSMLSSESLRFIYPDKYKSRTCSKRYEKVISDFLIGEGYKFPLELLDLPGPHEEKRKTLNPKEKRNKTRREKKLRKVVESQDKKVWSTEDRYRYNEMVNVRDLFKSHYQISFHIDHAKSLLNPLNHGKHHPDNMHLMYCRKNLEKSNSNIRLMSVEKQRRHLMFHLEDSMDIGLIDKKCLKVASRLVDRLISVYNIENKK